MSAVSESSPKIAAQVGRGLGREGVARALILDAATELIYANGIRGTSADRIIEQAGITKVTFYRHFRTKTDLVVAYLERQAALEREAFDSARDHTDPLRSLQNIAGFIGAASCMPGFRGCAFINAAAETPDPADPVRVVVDAHRRWTREMFASIAADAGVADPEKTARQLMMLRDGAMVGGYLGDPDEIAETLQGAYLATIASALPA
ncbi:TetR/AcrR family transcriptional regulator [Compostimonas suwonensis]|uniref:AcrR family transcriptional regulator n=1 Tax=Compostimonas suwonensis TaxID=1048394 RepID=A0A2M9BBB9_9MICO|nr:TetR/AcrR family transcriptional regulator [Compostimonas suwonensis]PJJ55240.1 AcrR family transcriptional regulator [Compostimonas suwonensis]